MKKIKNVKLFLIIFLVLCVLVFFSNQNNNDADIFGKVAFLSGKVTLTKLNSNEPSALKINTMIFLGDTIETAKESKVEILLTDNKSKITIFENTKVKLSTLLTPDKKKQTIISIFYGSINSFVVKLSASSSYTIQSPNGSASVRGTEFSFTVTDTLDSLVMVSEGVVAYQKEEEGGFVELTQNQYCITEIDKKPEVSSGKFDNQTWLYDRNSQFEQNSGTKASFVVANLINIVKTVANLILAIKDFTQNSIIIKLLTKRLTPFDLTQFVTQKGLLLQKVYEFYFRLNFYDTIALGFYRFFDFLSVYNSEFIVQKQKCWELHLELSQWTSKVVEIYKVLWLFY